jgi:hypothetical protein
MLTKIAQRCRRRDRFVRKTAKLLRGIRPPDGLDKSVRFGDWAAPRLGASSGEFFAAVPDESADVAALHRFRIRGKALRYTMELVAPAFGPALRNMHYPVVEELQERLGRIQDHVVAADRVREWADDAKDCNLRDVLRDLAAKENARMEEEQREFRRWWTPERVESLRQGLIHAVSAICSHALPANTIASRSSVE